ncbi:Valine--pyruvate aminotransferase [Psychrobacter pasteurii]|uniref:Valine--pyruvate aminotransferase n=1 Tax=Psychrobacter pasteurii TaxID=1945520 RepID=A0A1R4ECG4_9GAMM|nr:valine--pyruvate transaminase [Psychrobacter pasteurii]SJM36165.1 Valine--pyruvate aminotransferase [Psychrobacter pasteurii]
MKFSKYGQQFTKTSAISQLMDDLGDALKSPTPVNMLGGGNPARIDKVNEAYFEVYKSLEQGGIDGGAIESVGNYSNPQGDAKFIDALVAFFNRHYDWNLTTENIVLTNGSQNAFFYLFNLFGGQFEDEKGEISTKSILLPLAPEYIGYSDVHIDGKHFIAIKPEIEEVEHKGETGFFKYKIDFDALENLPALKNGEIGAICCSRPTNPTGNVLTDEEMAQLSAIAKQYDVPLIIDNAYGEPFPNIIYPDVNLNWDKNTVLCFSLSKIGLPGARTGIIIAAPEVVKTVSAMNAVVNLAPTRFGAAIATPLLNEDRLKELCDDTIQPFYAKKAKKAITHIKEEMGDYPVLVHKPEGAIFLWVWFKDLPISTTELYDRLKEKATLIVPSEHFYPGLDTTDYPHAHQCIRMSIAASDETLESGIKVIGEVVRELYDNQA